MKLSIATGMAAGILALIATPALAAPASVTVRVEGASTTRVPLAKVTTTSQPVVKAGAECSGTSAGGALDRASGGDWDATYFGPGLGHFVTTIKGEAPIGNDSWTVWVNHRSSPVGACSLELQEADDVLFFVERCEFNGSECANPPVVPLGLTAPATATAGSTGEVSVVSYAATGAATPVEGARVAGPGIDVTTGPSGRATVSFAAAGTVRLQATKTGLVRSETRDVVVSAPGATSLPPTTGASGSVAAADKAAPTAALIGLRDKQVLSAGPRELRGRFADASGIKTVKLRLTKRLGNRCWYFSGRMERFRGTRCGRGASFVIGDRAEWSYLLPARLGEGRYVLDAIAVDGAGNRTPLARGTTRVVFTVR